MSSPHRFTSCFKCALYHTWVLKKIKSDNIVHTICIIDFWPIIICFVDAMTCYVSNTVRSKLKKSNMLLLLLEQWISLESGVRCNCSFWQPSKKKEKRVFSSFFFFYYCCDHKKKDNLVDAFCKHQQIKEVFLFNNQNVIWILLSIVRVEVLPWWSRTLGMD